MSARRRPAPRVGTGALALLAGIVAAVVPAGCSGDGDRIVVAAASSLGEVAEGVAAEVEAAEPGTEVVVTTGSTAALAAQLAQGSPFDVLVAADDRATAQLVDDGAAASEVAVVARNRLVLVVPADGPDGIDDLADLAEADVVALCAPDAPCGRYAAEALDAAGVALDEGRVTRGANARATLAAVAEGGASAGLVYATDAASATDRVTAVELPPGVAPEVVATAVALDGDGDAALRDAYLAALVGQPGRDLLAEAGFERP